jgi:hypothetical protein
VTRYRAPVFASRVVPLLLLGPLTGCSGNGSDIGPVLPDLPNHTFTVAMVDGQGRPVTGAQATLSGNGASTGSSQAGRIEFARPLTGAQFLDIRAGDATATGIEQFPDLRIPVAVATGNDEPPRPVVLPDLAAAARVTLTTGNQAGPANLTAGGVTLNIPAGTQVVTTGGAATVTLVLAALAAEDLPVPLPPAGGGAWLAGRAVWFEPRDVLLAPGAILSLPNDLGLPSGLDATLFRLDTTTGAWQSVGTLQRDASNLLTNAVPLVTGPGIFCAAVVVAATGDAAFTVVGSDQVTVSGVLVCGPAGAAVRADSNGGVLLRGLPVQDASGAPATLGLVLTAPRGYRPARMRLAATAAGGTFAVANQTLDTVPTGLVQILGIVRGAVAPLRRVRVGGPRLFTFATGLLGADGTVRFPDMELGIYDVRMEADVGLPFEIMRALTRGTLTARGGALDIDLFGARVNPRAGNALNFATLLASDAGSGAAIEGARMHLVDIAGNQRDVGVTTEFGALSPSGAHLRDATASLTSTRAGATAITCFTVVRVDNVRVELPLLRLLATTGSSFGAFATVAGDLDGGVGGALLRKVDGFGPLNEHDWRTAVLEGQPLAMTLKRIDPELAAGSTRFRITVPAGPADVVAQRGTGGPGGFTLEALGAVAGLELQSGAVLQATPAFDLPITTPQTLTGLRASLDARIPETALRLDLGAVRSNGRALDLARQLAGNLTVAGADVVAMVPPAASFLAGAPLRLGWVSASAAQGSITRAQGVLFRVAANPVATSLPAVPEVIAPPPGAVVAAAGFDFRWTPPPGTNIQLVELLSQTATETLRWQVLLPPDVGIFNFPTLLNNPPRPLIAGRTYKLSVRCYFATEGFAVGTFDEYQRLMGTFASMARSEQGITAVSSASLQVVCQ